MYLLFNSDIANLLLKTNWGGVRDRKPKLVIFVVWSILIVVVVVGGGGVCVCVCVFVAWGRKSFLGSAEIASFVFLALFKDGGRMVSSRFHLFVFDVNQENEASSGSSFYVKCKRHFM